jgi:hypothetical protein
LNFIPKSSSAPPGKDIFDRTGCIDLELWAVVN